MEEALVTAALTDLVAELDVAAGVDAGLGPPHEEIVLGEALPHRFQHLRQHRILPHLPNDLCQGLLRFESHRRSPRMLHHAAEEEDD